MTSPTQLKALSYGRYLHPRLRAAHAVLLGITVFLTGCSLLPPKKPAAAPTAAASPIHRDDYPEMREAVECLAANADVFLQGSAWQAKTGCPSIASQANYIATDYYRKHESPLYPGLRSPDLDDADWPDGHPQLCLAFSGGGIRAASVAIGVLQGFEEEDLLKEVDLISSVSGGSYANYWFQTQLLGRNLEPCSSGRPCGRGVGGRNEGLDGSSRPSRGDLFQQDGPYQEHLENSTFIPRRWAGASVVFGVLGRQLSRVPEWLLRRNERPNFWSQSHIFYSGALERVFLWNPEQRFADRWLPSFEAVEQNLREAALPFPVINTTATSGRSACGKRKQPWTRSIFEFTPLRYGSDGFGFSDRLSELNLTSATAVSGAALDNPYALHCPVSSQLGLNLGLTLDAFWAAPKVREAGQASTQPARWLRLSDGGFADNLGVFSAVKRLCRTIVAVDSSHDPALLFKGLDELQRHLKTDLGAKLELHGLEQAHWNRGNLGEEWREKHVLRRAIKGRSPHGFVAHRYGGDQEPPATPVLVGKIGAFDYAGKDQPLELNLIYIKLATNEGILAELPHARAHAMESRDPAQGDPGCRAGLFGISQCPFPQASTRDQSFTAGQFRAYRELGSYLGRKAAIEVRQVLP